MPKVLVLAFLLTLSLQHVTFAQSDERETVTQSLEWFSITSNIKVHKHAAILAEGQFRFARVFEPMQFQLRTGLELHLTKNLAVMPIGYVYTLNPTYGKQPNTFVNNEHRLFQQVVFKHTNGRLHFNHRVRLEQRFIQTHVSNNGEVVNEGYKNFANRIRYKFTLNIPLNSHEIGPKTLFVSLYEEVFSSWGPHVTYHEPDQNRAFAGVGYQFTKKMTITSGFLYQMLIKAGGAKQENNLGVQVAVGYNIDLTR